MSGKKSSKLQSAKLWITIWGIGMITFIVAADKTDFYGIAQLLCAVPLAYIGTNVWQKAIYSKADSASSSSTTSTTTS